MAGLFGLRLGPCEAAPGELWHEDVQVCTGFGWLWLALDARQTHRPLPPTEL